MRPRFIVILAFTVACITAFIAITMSEQGMAAAPETARYLAACDVEAYVVDPDPKGLNVRSGAGIRSEMIGRIPHDNDGTIVRIVKSANNGWVQIDKAETIDGTPVFNGIGWIWGQMLATSTRGYSKKSVKLFRSYSRSSKVVTSIPMEEEVRIAGCSGKWIKLKYKNYTGWLQPDDQCPNPVTNCS